MIAWRIDCMANDVKTSYMGLKVYKTKLGQSPTSADLVSNVVQVGGGGHTFRTIDVTDFDSNGVAQLMATIADLNVFNVTLNIVGEAAYDSMVSQADKLSSDADFNFDLYIIAPKPVNFTKARGIKLTGFMSNFQDFNATQDTAQQIAFDFQPVLKPTRVVAEITE